MFIFNSLKLSNFLPKWLYVPTNTEWEFLLLYIFNSNWYCQDFLFWFIYLYILKFSHSDHCVMVTQSFNSQLLKDIWGRASIHILKCYLYNIFDEVSAQIFCPFYTFFVFLLLNFKNYLYILDTCFLLPMCLVNIFPCP